MSVSNERIEEARSMRDAGASWSAVAKRFGVHHDTPRKWLEPEYRAARSRSNYQPGPAVKVPAVTDAVIEQARSLRRDYELSWEQIAHRLKVSYETLRKAADPEYAERRRANARKAYNSAGKREYQKTGAPRASAGSVTVPPAVLADAARIRNTEPTIHQAVLGDPMPGRSALDRRQSAP